MYILVHVGGGTSFKQYTCTCKSINLEYINGHFSNDVIGIVVA